METRLVNQLVEEELVRGFDSCLYHPTLFSEKLTTYLRSLDSHFVSL